MEQNNKKEYMSGKDMLYLPDGSIYHLGAKKGEIFERIITVGDHKRADMLAQFFDKNQKIFCKVSSRLFKIYSGYYKGVGISVIGIGMGVPMMDFMLREASALLSDKEMYVIRLGTCGIINNKINTGDIIVANKGCYYCGRNYTYFDSDNSNKNITNEKPYIISPLCILKDEKLLKLLMDALNKNNVKFCEGLNLSGETFYATQGRRNEDFMDDNDYLLDELKNLNIDTIEMESHTLYHLSNHRKTFQCYAAALHVGIANRVIDKDAPNVTEEQLEEAVKKGGLACFEALAAAQ